ncbi:MAG: phytoene desaturase [Candidatus Azobacteroides sp.]|nr:phytoene desaturase [Candidatus Azobacteroides sp.]
MKKIKVIGAGLSGLSAACYLASSGYDVTIYEKNELIGGRARKFCKDGFTFDMGPTFYWMPDVFEKFFADFGKKTTDFYRLIRLDPGYEICFGKKQTVCIPADFKQTVEVFDKIEPGSGKRLKKFIEEAGYNYKVAMEKVVYKPGKSPLELVMPEVAGRFPQFFTTLGSKVRRRFKNKQLRQALEFPVLFLGAKAMDMPAFYCFMNYADMKLGTWHIEGGMFELVAGIKKLAESLGVKIETSSPVEKIITGNRLVREIVVKGKKQAADAVISGADYHYTELLLEKNERNYKEAYWQKRVMAPSALLFYIGFNKKLENVSHHTLFFDTDFEAHVEKVYKHPGWPAKPLFYASFPSKTDSRLAPEGKEAAIILIPLAVGLKDTKEIRERYFEEIIDRMEKMTGQSIKENVLFYESYAGSDFISDYHAYKGNAYGLANTLFQTAFLKPKIRNKKIRNLFYTGQLTVPGPGVPTAIISGKIAAEQLMAYLGNKRN